MNPCGTTGGFFGERNQRYQLPSLHSEHGELTNTEAGLKSRERSPYHTLLLAVLFHSKLVLIISPALSPLVLCKPQNTVKTPTLYPSHSSSEHRQPWRSQGPSCAS